MVIFCTRTSLIHVSIAGLLLLYPSLYLTFMYSIHLMQSPRIAAGEFSQWLCLPDEIWLHICGYLSHRDLSRVAQTCMQIHRVALDESLCKSIQAYRLITKTYLELSTKFVQMHTHILLLGPRFPLYVSNKPIPFFISIITNSEMNIIFIMI